MARGVRADLRGGDDRVAGPDPSDGQPVGTAHIAVSVADDTVVRTIALTGDRHEIRRLTVEHALGLLLGRLRKRVSDYSVTLAANTHSMFSPTGPNG